MTFDEWFDGLKHILHREEGIPLADMEKLRDKKHVQESYKAFLEWDKKQGNKPDKADWWKG